MSDGQDPPDAGAASGAEGASDDARAAAGPGAPGTERASGASGAKVQAELARAEAERIALQISARSRSTARRSVGSPLLFAIVYTPLASALYFALGVISGHALGLTPLVFLVAALMFALTAMTYAEGASLHQERSGSTVFARYAFNELVSFVAGWAILLDYVILIAVTSLLGDAVPARLLASARRPRRLARALDRVHRDRRARRTSAASAGPPRGGSRRSSPPTSRCRG